MASRAKWRRTQRHDVFVAPRAHLMTYQDSPLIHVLESVGKDVVIRENKCIFVREQPLRTPSYAATCRERVESFDLDLKSIWKDFEATYLEKSVPVKFADWPSLIIQKPTEIKNTCLDSARPMESIPEAVLDMKVTVQCKLRSQKKCRRDPLHTIEQAMTVCPGVSTENLFFGQEDQVTTTMTLRRVLNGDFDSETMRLYIAQELIYSSDEEPRRSVIVTSKGAVIDGTSCTQPREPLASLLPWVRLPSALFPSEDTTITQINLWYSPDVSRTNMHYDGHHNILIALRGSKTVEILPPNALTGSPIHSNHANHPAILRSSTVGGPIKFHDLENNLDSMKYMFKADAIVATISRGEAIFIPEGWWHRVESTADCLAINVWFDHNKTSVDGFARESNEHILAYQAREMVRRYVDSMFIDVSMQKCKMQKNQFWDSIENRSEMKMRMKAFPSQSMGAWIDLLQLYGNEIFLVEDERSHGSSKVPSLRSLAMKPNVADITMLLNFFLLSLDATKPHHRISAVTAIDAFPILSTPFQHEVFLNIVLGLEKEPCFLLSQIWEHHVPAEDAEGSYQSFFDRCGDDRGRRHVVRQVDAFKDSVTKTIIEENLMLLNPVDSIRGNGTWMKF